MKTLASLRWKTLTVTFVILLMFAFLHLPIASAQSPSTEWERTYGIGEGYSVVQTSDGGYAIGGGDTDNYYASFHENYVFLLIKTDAAGVMEWSKTYGERGEARSYAQSVIQTTDGGYALAGKYVVPRVDANNNYYLWSSFRLVKTDERGNLQWDKTYLEPVTSSGGCTVIQTRDEGYVLAGDMGFTHNSSAWLVKTDKNGNMQWSKSYGDSHYGLSLNHYFFSVLETDDGGLIAAGSTDHINETGTWFIKTSAWLVKTDEMGNVQWRKTYQNQNINYFRHVSKTRDGGFLLTARDTSGDTGEKAVLVKTGSNGNVEWNKTYTRENSKNEMFWSAKQTLDGGYIAIGLSQGSYGNAVWVVKTDGDGNEEWTGAQYGGPDDYSAMDITVARYGGYVFVGNNKDRVWLVKIPSTIAAQHEETPEIQWERNYGFLEGNCLIQTSDEGYAIAGADAEYYRQGRDAYWVKYTFQLIKTTPTGDVEWKRTYGDPESTRNVAYSVVQTKDDGYAIVGTTTAESLVEGTLQSGVFFWLVKTDANGNMIWNKMYVGPVSSGRCMGIQTSDGGYAIAGSAFPRGTDKSEAWLVKTDGAGNVEWTKTFASANNEQFNSIVEADDGGVVAAGTIYVENRAAAWLVKINSRGNEQWSKTYRAEGAQDAYSVIKTKDGGYLIGGRNTPPRSSDYLGLLIKTDSNGNFKWSNTYWTSSGDSNRFRSVAQTLDGGYVATGTVDDGVWIVKTRANGDKIWDLVNGDGEDESKCIIATKDGGCAFTGERYSHDPSNDAIMLVKVAPQFTSDVVGITPDLAYTVLLGIISIIVVMAILILLYDRRTNSRNKPTLES